MRIATTSGGVAVDDRTAEPQPARQREAAGDHAWTIADSDAVYEPGAWGGGYFAIRDDGTLGVRPTRSEEQEADLHAVVEGLRARGLTPPLIVRFPEILSDRLRLIREAFATAIREGDYRGDYLIAYPIKVNHQRSVVEQLAKRGGRGACGLEVGSKPELLAALALTAGSRPRTPIVCNGFKDSSYLEAVVLASKLGRDIVPVIESLDELEMLASHAIHYDVRPTIGIRAKLAAGGSGRWHLSTGAGSKFGLAASEIVEAVERLRHLGLLDSLRFLHAHAGSQLQEIRSVRDTVGELTHLYVELVRLGAPMDTIDVGGGLAVDYDGSRAASSSSMNYSLQEYASEVVYRVGSICDRHGVEHPRIVSESGRALVAHHSVLIFDVLGTATRGRRDLVAPIPEPADPPQVILDLQEALESISLDRLLECFHDADAARREAVGLFALGYLSLEMRGLAERLFWAVCDRIRELVPELERAPDELDVLDEVLADTYYGNLSIFQSLPDAWAIDQRFPIMPIHRLDERPTRRARLADITCDSDGRIDCFTGSTQVRRTLPLHELNAGQPYYLAAFLAGAYQETLGDLHNLFGDTHVVQVRVSRGDWRIGEVVRGDTARDVLRHVQYDPDRLQARMADDCERAIRANRMSVLESRALLNFYESELGGYTYLTEGPEA